MILNRIQPYIDPILRPNQNGFRSGRSTTSHILALRQLFEGVKSHNLKTIIIFVDFKKAFDSINRATMLQILEAYVNTNNYNPNSCPNIQRHIRQSDITRRRY